MGKGTFPGTDEYYMGMLGMHGTKGANLLVGECDLLIVLGARFSDRDVGSPKTFAKQAKILQIDVDPAEINKNVVVDAKISGDLREVLKRLLPEIQEKNNEDWVAEMKAKQELVNDVVPENVLTGPYVIEKVYEVTKGDALICTDVGQHQMWTAQYYKFKDPRQLLTSGGLGTMGYGLGAAIGAKCGRPEKTVINIAGDGCFRMNMNEVATATRSNIPVIEIVINNHVLGMVRQWQTLFYGQRYSNTVLEDKVDFVKVAESMGARGVRVTKPEEFAPALEAAIASGEPTVIECVVASDDKVSPMIPAGMPNNKIYDQEDMKNWKN
jgi:acetolactate synthase-1/2/3 large subunit